MGRFLTVVAGLAVMQALACAPAERADEPPIGNGRAAAAEEHAVTLREWVVELVQDNVAAGPAVFVVRNSGQYNHSLEIEGQGREWETEEIAPGGEARLTVELTPGTYDVYCPIEDSHGDHRDLGMRTVLTVR